MDGECRFQGPLFLHASVHHAWRDEKRPLPQRSQHMLDALKLNVPGTLRFMAACTLADHAADLCHRRARKSAACAEGS